jgi:DNA-binding transcriptional LysR family regulator
VRSGSPGNFGRGRTYEHTRTREHQSGTSGEHTRTNVTLASQVRQLEDITRTTLLHTSPDGTITLTVDGEQFARQVVPVLESPAQSRAKA